jgi:hypothetical protein
MKNIDFVSGVEHLHGNFYKIPFASIVTTDKKEDNENYSFYNPRLLTKNGIDVLTNKDLSKNLRENIKIRTLLTPFICRWIEKEESLSPQLVGGDRRYRALDYLISKKEMVADPRTPQGSAVSADIAYEFVICQVFNCENDLEAATLSWAENKNRIDLTEGHEVAAVMELRRFGASDDSIMEVLQKDSRWLHETDELIEALKSDEETLNLFCEDKIKRGAIKKLIEISDLEERSKIRDQAMQMAEVVFEEKNKKFEKQKNAIANKKARAETRKVFAENVGDEKETEKADRILSRVKERELDIENNKPNSPRITQKQVEKLTSKTRSTVETQLHKSAVKNVANVLSTIQSIIEKEGTVDFLDEEFELDVSLLHLIKMTLENHVLGNSDDFGATLTAWHETLNSSSTTFVDDDEEEEVRDDEEEYEDDENEDDEDEGRPEESDEYNDECDVEAEEEDYYDESAENLLDNADEEEDE